MSHDAILELRSAVISAGLTESRRALLAGISPELVASLPDSAAPGAQVLTDLDALRTTGALADGSVPLVTWLQNAVRWAETAAACSSRILAWLRRRSAIASIVAREDRTSKHLGSCRSYRDQARVT